MEEENKKEFNSKYTLDYKTYKEFSKGYIATKKSSIVMLFVVLVLLILYMFYRDYETVILFGSLFLIFAFLISLLIIGCGALVGLILDNALYNLARSIHIDFIQNLMNNGTLFGALIGVIVAIIYLLRHWAKLDDLRYQTENVEKKEEPILHFDQMRIEKKTYQLLKEDRLK